MWQKHKQLPNKEVRIKLWHIKYYSAKALLCWWENCQMLAAIVKKKRKGIRSLKVPYWIKLRSSSIGLRKVLWWLLICFIIIFNCHHIVYCCWWFGNVVFKLKLCQFLWCIRPWAHWLMYCYCVFLHLLLEAVHLLPGEERERKKVLHKYCHL